MKKEDWKLVYAGLAAISVLVLLSFTYIKAGIGVYTEGVTFLEVAGLDMWLWIAPIITIAAAVLLFLNGKASKLLPLLSIIIHVGYYFLLKFIMTYSYADISLAMGFYIVILLHIGMIVIESIIRKAN